MMIWLCENLKVLISSLLLIALSSCAAPIGKPYRQEVNAFIHGLQETADLLESRNE
jgi:hypothetical protein